MSAGKGWFVADHLGRYSIPKLVEAEQVLELAAHIFELRIATGEPFTSGAKEAILACTACR